MAVRPVDQLGGHHDLRRDRFAREVPQHGASGDGCDIERAEIDACQHAATLDVVDGGGKAVDADDRCRPAGVPKGVERAERHHVVGRPYAVDVRVSGQQFRHGGLRRLLQQMADPRAQELDPRRPGEGVVQPAHPGAAGRHRRQAFECNDPAFALQASNKSVRSLASDRFVVRTNEGDCLASHAIDDEHDRDLRRGKPRQVLFHLQIVGRIEDHGVGPCRQCLDRKSLLLADMVGGLRHIVHGAGTCLGRDAVGGKARGIVGRVDAVLGEDGDRGLPGHGGCLRLSAGVVETTATL